uniref:Uncharacterized protein n=1 Tax=Manihot esculenta TaxID=3983 RepID=A0A2C9U0D1_MANES
MTYLKGICLVEAFHLGVILSCQLRSCIIVQLNLNLLAWVIGRCTSLSTLILYLYVHPIK